MQGIRTLFLDIGGVLLSDGWDRYARRQSAVRFDLNINELEDRHRLIFNTYELGKLTLDDYLDHLLFYKKQQFPKEEFADFMYKQSQPVKGSISFFKGLKRKYNLKVVAVSNEVRELNDYRIQKYKLTELFDLFISFCYVHLRKPDPEMFRLACDLSQTQPENAFFIDDRQLYVEMAAKSGIAGYRFRDVDSAKLFFKSSKFMFQ